MWNRYFAASTSAQSGGRRQRHEIYSCNEGRRIASLVTRVRSGHIARARGLRQATQQIDSIIDYDRSHVI